MIYYYFQAFNDERHAKRVEEVLEIYIHIYIYIYILKKSCMLGSMCVPVLLKKSCHKRSKQDVAILHRKGDASDFEGYL